MGLPQRNGGPEMTIIYEEELSFRRPPFYKWNARKKSERNLNDLSNDL